MLPDVWKAPFTSSVPVLLRHPRTSFEAEVVASFSSILKCIDAVDSI